MSRRILLIVVLAAFVLQFAACNDEDECVNCPSISVPPVTMANIWPHLDGTVWSFHLEYRELEESPRVGSKSGHVPSFVEIHELMESPMEGVVAREEETTYQFGFNGMIETHSGAVGQRVVETFSPEWWENSDSSGALGVDRAMAVIARMRPDLRPTIAARLDVNEKDMFLPPYLYFLGGYAFAYEDSGYYGYGDLNRSHSWVYLEGDLSVGSEFSQRLGPGLDQEIWLRGKVWSVRSRTINGVTYPRVLECLYLIDLGEVYYSTAYGDSYGPYYPYIYGRTFFVPGIGPVGGTERRVMDADDVLQEGWIPLVEFELELEDLSLPD